MTTDLKIECAQCRAAVPAKETKGGEPKVPFKWKKLNGVPLCPKCLAESWTKSAVTISVAEAFRDDENGDNKSDWPGFKLALHKSWRRVSQISNWATRQLFLSDVTPEADANKLPKWTKPYLYPSAVAAFPDVPTNTLSQILQTVERKYGSVRREAILWNERSVQTYSMAFMSLPIKSGTWKLSIDDEGRPWLAARIGSDRWRMQLVVNRGTRRAIAALRRVVAGEFEATALAIKPQTRWSNRGDGVETRAAGGQFGKRRLHPMAVITIYKPAGAAIDATETLHISTESDCLLKAVLPSGRELRWHMNHLRGRVAAYSRWRQSLADDKKAERRRPRRETRMMRDAESRTADKNNRRLNTACHQIAASFVGLAVRQQLKIAYDFRRCGFFTSFPFSKLETMLLDKCKTAGISVVNVAETERSNGDAHDTVRETGE